ncbi:MAG: DUF1993 family protein [Alphaproteobacteria bacterium]|nr:DUF1993 family protein [Alphaproteobacteria bacterium]
MALTLYDALVPGFLQTLGGVKGFMDRGLAHCADNGIDPQEIVETRLFPDMLPFRFQVVSAAHHSFGALQGAMKGESGPPNAPPEIDYAGLQKLISDAIDGVKAMSPADVNNLEGKDVTFKLPNFALPFTGEGFLLSFALPNFHFHATTAYDILRMKGVPLGKRDYLGALRMKQ